ncbi:MAG: deaminase [Minisyncoccia bacterium]
MEDSDMTAATIKYPYLPPGREIRYVAEADPWMREAREYAREHSLDAAVKTGAIVVKEGVVIGRGANGSTYHQTHGCERVKRSIPTGQGYELCEGCHPKNHAERQAVFNAMKEGYDAQGADLYLWGHWWACEPCWKAMIEAGIANVYLMKGSEVLFNKEHTDNIIGRQFE